MKLSETRDPPQEFQSKKKNSQQPEHQSLNRKEAKLRFCRWKCRSDFMRKYMWATGSVLVNVDYRICTSNVSKDKISDKILIFALARISSFARIKRSFWPKKIALGTSKKQKKQKKENKYVCLGGSEDHCTGPWCALARDALPPLGRHHSTGRYFCW